MDLGTAITIVGVAIPASAVCVTAIKLKSNGNGKNGEVKTSVTFPCPAHSGFEAKIDELRKGQERIEKKVDRIFELKDEGKL